MNQFIVTNNLEALKELEPNIASLIYFDPPYSTGRDFSDFKDNIWKTNHEYAHDFLKPRIIEMKRVLKKDGNIIAHVEPKISHHVRFVMDEVFGESNFRTEIVWKSGGNKKSKHQLARFHDVLILYTKDQKSIFNPEYLPYDEEYEKTSNVRGDRKYVTTAIHNAQPEVNPRPNLRYEWNGHHKQWYVTKEKMQFLHDDNRLEYNKNGVPRIKRFLDEMEGIPIRDLWIDINQIQSGEKMDYATQKPIKLLERIVKMYSNEGDLVIDPFAGSGVVGRACLKHKRNYLLIDINEKGKDLFEQSIK